MATRTLAALGLDVVPVQQPLTYPGPPVPGPSLLTGQVLLELTAAAGPIGGWGVLPEGTGLDALLAASGQVVTGGRHPVLAVGSNAAPGQVAHKLSRMGLPLDVPMVPVQVQGVGIGCSGHISPAGYVAATPYAAQGLESRMVVAWLTPEQLAAVDDTEFPDYRRALLTSADFRMTLPSGEELSAAYIYYSDHGLLLDPAGAPRAGGGDQAALLASLLADSAALRALLGPDPSDWVERARADTTVREAGTRQFTAEGWVRPQDEFVPFAVTGGGGLFYDDLLAGAVPSA